MEIKNNYVVHTAIKCSDGKIHRLSYDLTRQTEGSVHEVGRVFTEIEKRFPDVQFWIQKYPEDMKDASVLNGDFNNLEYIHGESPIFNNEIQTMKSE
mgnify:CR=1 FL=1